MFMLTYAHVSTTEQKYATSKRIVHVIYIFFANI